MLLILVLPWSAQDYLDGGYVGSGDSGDIAQYFTDPIFRSPSGSYVSPDPAVRGMQESLDRPIAPVGSTVPRSKTAYPRIACPQNNRNIHGQDSRNGVAGRRCRPLEYAAF